MNTNGLEQNRTIATRILLNKTGARLSIEVTGELAATIARISVCPRHAISAYLIQDETSQPLTRCALRSHFDKARTLAKVDFQFRDIRAKAATDTGDLAHSQKLLAHKNWEMTKHYVKARMGGNGSNRYAKGVAGATVLSFVSA